ncbi:hypothetical protein [Rhizobium mayense]|uniref:Transcriptional regulator n=1 Tax=Rhizobium mayense TaxID=1312184 RepID=A0ABT7JYL6_9HYPH|nr:hypothetical protein [Rhizobium mayense]MDL2401027.1 hypothetical protein [Rhizobium mayense]
MGDLPYLAKLRAYGQGNPSQEHLEAIETELFNGPDRGAAVVLTALVEKSLEHLLKREMREEGVSALFEFNGPMGTFSNKIAMAFSLKLIGTKTKHDLTIIRTLRNVFAHSRLPVTFETEVVAVACGHLCLPDEPGVFLNSNMLEKVSNDRLAEATDIKHPRTRFFTTCNEIAKRIYWIRVGEDPQHHLNVLP